MVARHTADFSEYQDAVEIALAGLKEERVVERIWAGDHTVWGPKPEEIANRLGWLKSPQVMREELEGISALVEAVRNEGYTHALLLGMGGSSLAPEVYRNVFGVADGRLDLAVLDSTDPDAVLEHADRLDLSRTLFVVSTKSGGTVETFSFFKYFYNRVSDTLDEDRAGEHFVAHAGILADLDPESSWARYMVALESDVGDVQSGTTQEGIHMGVMAGTLDLIQRGYMGSEIRDGVLCFNPKPVGNLDGLSFPMRFRGMPLEVGLEGDELTVAAQSDGFSQPIKVGVGNQIQEIKAGERHTFAL